MKRSLLFLIGLFASVTASAQLYIVNGEEYSVEQMRRIDPERVESSELVPVNDSIMVLYGVSPTNASVFALIVHSTQTLLVAVLGLYALVMLQFRKTKDKQ